MVTDVEKALAALNIPSLSERGSEILAHCPMHVERTGKQDNNPSWSINKDTGVHLCFSCGYKGSLITLVSDVKKFRVTWGVADVVDYDAAKEWLTTNAALSVEDLALMLKRAPEYVRSVDVIPMSEARLAVYDAPPAWALDKRGLSEESAEYYGVKWDNKLNCWITPIRDPETGKLWGWQEKGEKDRYFKNRPTGVKKSLTLFGFDKVQKDQLVLVESPLDALRLHTAGIPNGVASFGASVSVEQVKLLRQAEKVIIAMDNPYYDTAGLKASEYLLDMCRKYNIEAYFLNYGDTTNKDIGSMTDSQIHVSIDTARHMVYGKSAFIS